MPRYSHWPLLVNPASQSSGAANGRPAGQKSRAAKQRRPWPNGELNPRLLQQTSNGAVAKEKPCTLFTGVLQTRRLLYVMACFGSG